ncbi:unnamed protein product [Sphagnum balticum]
MPFRKGNHKAKKLVGEQVLEIREKWNTGKYTFRRLAIEYNVSTNTIGNIINRLSWQNIAEPGSSVRIPPDRIRQEVDSEEVRRAARESFERFQALSEAPIPPNPMLNPPQDDKFGRPDLMEKLLGEARALKKVDEDLENFEKGDSDDESNR